MITFSELEKQQLAGLGVTAVYLFGSRAQGIEGPLSDYDFGVLVEQVKQRRGGKLYNKLYDLLAPHCPRTLKNDILDIVFLRDAPLELRFHVIRYGRILYDPSPIERLQFETQTVLEYCDFRPILDQVDRTILASV